MKAFDQLVRERHPEVEGQTLLALDPGDTTGFAVFEGWELVNRGQISGTHKMLHRLIDAIKPDVIVFEEYRIYATHVKEHINSNVPTLRLIGGIEMLCHLYQIPMYVQGAGQAKTFITDDKILYWNFFDLTHETRHATDAVRHACYYLIVGGKEHDPFAGSRIDPRDGSSARAA